jgi:hypothetical protein
MKWGGLIFFPFRQSRFRMDISVMYRTAIYCSHSSHGGLFGVDTLWIFCRLFRMLLPYTSSFERLPGYCPAFTNLWPQLRMTVYPDAPTI